MVRTFETHRIRKQTELTGCMWDFKPLSGEHAGESYRVQTPCCWESHPDFGLYRGEGEYIRRFHAGGNLRLEFKGVSHTATCYFDGKVIAEHYNAYTAFDTELKDVPYGEHTLVIKADNRFSEASALHIPNDYMSYGGVSRPVVLENISECFIKYVHVNTVLVEDSWKAEIKYAVKNMSDSDQQVVIKIIIAGKCFEDCVELKANSVTEGVAFIEGLDVETWCPENPKLYEACSVLLKDGQEIDDFIDRVGFREIKLSGKDILLNGKKLRIKGFCRHEDHPQFGCALPYDVMAKDIELIKNMGGNAIRTSHYPNDELFLDICDENGLVVWEENHARGLSLENMQNPNFEPQAEKVIYEMIEQHFNHPCIIMWGILNECASETEYGRECYKAQLDIIAKQNPDRPKTFATCKFFNDICLDLPDIVSYNLYPQWYHDTPVDEYLKDIYDWVQEKTGGAGKPFIVSEIGAGAIWGYSNSFDGKWTEEYQAKAIEKQLNAIFNHEGCSGVFIWQFCDVRVSEEWFEKRPRCMNNKGIVDEFRRKKKSYDVVKKNFESYGNYFE